MNDHKENTMNDNHTPDPTNAPTDKGRATDLIGVLIISAALITEMVGDPSHAVILAIFGHAYITKGR